MFRVAKWKGTIGLDRRKYFERTETGETEDHLQQWSHLISSPTNVHI